MKADERDTSESSIPAAPLEHQTADHSDTVESTVAHRDFSEWQGKDLIDRDGERIGKLEDVYFDVSTDQPQFGLVKEGLIGGRHLTFVPLTQVTIGPDFLQAAVSKAQVKDAPNAALDNDGLSPADESALYHYYELNYTPSDTPSGRRLVRR
jgi:hypothetical protein